MTIVELLKTGEIGARVTSGSADRWLYWDWQLEAWRTMEHRPYKGTTELYSGPDEEQAVAALFLGGRT